MKHEKKKIPVKWVRRETVEKSAAEMILWDILTLSLIFMSSYYASLALIESDELSLGNFVTVVLLASFMVIMCDGLIPGIISRIEDEKPLKKPRRTRFLCELGFFALVCVALLYFYHKYKRGIYLGQHYIIELFLAPFNRIYKRSFFSGNAGKGIYMDYAILFWGIVLMVLVYFLSRLLSHRWTYLIMPCLVISLTMFVGRAPEWPALLLLALSIYMIFGTKPTPGRILPAAAALFMMVLLFAGIGRFFEGAADGLLEKSDEIKDIQAAIEYRISRFFNSFTIGGDAYISNAKPKYSDEKVMMVSVPSRPSSNIYFQEYYGSAYEDGLWKNDADDFETACEASVGLDTGQEALAERLFIVADNYNAASLKYDIEYSSSLGKKMFLPYGSKIAELDEPQMTGDVVVGKKMFSGEQKITALANESFDVRFVRNATTVFSTKSSRTFFEWYNGYAAEMYSDTDGSVPAAGQIARTITNDSRDTLGNRKDENIYRINAANLVSGYLGTHYTYSWNLKAIKDGKDPIEFFLVDGKKGYCEHFASAGVLILREMGVPARYASGYVAKPASFSKSGDGYKANIIDRNAHAWAEIYLDDIGWVPVEMTPGYDPGEDGLPTSASAQAERQRQEGNGTTPSPSAKPTVITNTPTPKPTKDPSVTRDPKNTKSATKQATKTPTPTKSGSSGGSGGKGEGTDTAPKDTLTSTVLTVIAIIAFVTLVLFCIVSVKEKNDRLIENEFRKKNYRKAIVRLNRRLYKKLRHKGKIFRFDLKDEEYLRVLKETCPEFGDENWDRYIGLVQRAAFSKGEFTEEEAKFVFSAYRLKGRKEEE